MTNQEFQDAVEFARMRKHDELQAKNAAAMERMRIVDIIRQYEDAFPSSADILKMIEIDIYAPLTREVA